MTAGAELFLSGGRFRSKRCDLASGNRCSRIDLRVLMGRFADQDGLEGRKTTAFLTIRHPELPSMRARLLQRPNRGEGPLFSKHKVPQGYSPADENAGSFTPFEMTVSKGTE